MTGYEKRDERLAGVLEELDKTQLHFIQALIDGYTRTDERESRLASAMTEGFADLYADMIWMIGLLRKAVERGALRG
jgi:hypothetical protein